jgi:DNA-binding MarR family transcriptional regulator
MGDEDTSTGEDARHPAARNTGYLLWQAVNRWQRVQKQALAPFNLTPVQFLLLSGARELGAAGDSPTQVVLARHCRTDPMMTSQVLRALEKERLVSRHAHDGDGRAMVVEVTETGRSVVAAAIKAVDQAEDEFFAALGPNVSAFGDALTLLTGERPRHRVRAGRA